MHKALSRHHSSDHARLVLAKTLAIISGKWRLRIIYQLAGQNLSYTDLHRSNPEVSEKVLIDELNELVALRFLQKESFRKVRTRVEYSLTERARSIMPVLDQLTQAVDEFLI
ncbi:winged helix-turn-helix transcriptional regulator [Spirosoma jeollabukense]